MHTMMVVRRIALASSSIIWQRSTTFAFVSRLIAFTPKNNLPRQGMQNALQSSKRNCEMDLPTDLLSMENIYTEWTIEDDKLLYENMNQPIHKVASLLGRGLNGVIARKKKLTDVQSLAYQRFFSSSQRKSGSNIQSENEDSNGGRLVPVKEVLRRIKWDSGLVPSDFMVQYFDRVDDKVYDCPFDRKNDSVKGKEEMFVFAIPEHRIMAIKYKERTVWDKESRLDCIFGSMNGNGETIYEVVETYEQWMEEEEERKRVKILKQKELTDQIRVLLGEDLFSSLKEMSKNMQERSKVSTITNQDVTSYVGAALTLFRRADLGSSGSGPTDDIESLNLFSDLVALLPDENLRERILLYIYQLISKLENERSPNKNHNQPLQPLHEEELLESFVRGSGAGGQKINKTSNRVVLVHLPTKIRVECQDTRSLQQNRKIARKRLQIKLDQHFNGISSRVEMKTAKKISKKAKSKARNRARQRRKKEAAMKGSNSDKDNNDN